MDCRDLPPAAVGGIFACTADRHLYKHGRERGDDHRDQHADEAERIVVLAVATEEEGEIAKHGNRTGERRRQRHRQSVRDYWI